MSELAYYSWGDDDLGIQDHAVRMASIAGPSGTLVVATAEGSTVISLDGSTISVDADGQVIHQPVTKNIPPVISEDK